MTKSIQTLSDLEAVTLDYLSFCYGAPTAPRVSEFAVRHRVPGRSLTRISRRWTGQTFSAYLKSLQLRYVIQLLGSSSTPVSHIALLAGFDHPRSFYRLFKRMTGTTPQRLRETALATNVSVHSLGNDRHS